jgi:N4-(beta-N-acetylglucosaminyl)-L-asparaginase
MNWVILATWPFSGPGVLRGAELLAGGGHAADAAQLAAEAVEDDRAVNTVGRGACPNWLGELELDAAFMDGNSLRVGAVAALKHYPHPVAVARRVMERSDHNLLVGAGAEDFACREGFVSENLLTPESLANWQRRLTARQSAVPRDPRDAASDHDTVGVLCLDQDGHLIAATSTSGIALKARGRVGDSPLIGSGFYADALIGAAAATGLGEDIMKGCVSYATVCLMEQGYSPNQAAEMAVRRCHDRLAGHQAVGDIAVICVDRQGRFGAAANHGHFAYWAAAADLAPQQIAVQAVASGLVRG